MQTQCPRCKAENELESEYFDAQDGRVRCPVCDFNYTAEDTGFSSGKEEPQKSEIVAEDDPSEDDLEKNQAVLETESLTRVEPTLDDGYEEDELNIRFLKDEYDSEVYEPKLNPETSDDASALLDSMDTKLDTEPVQNDLGQEKQAAASEDDSHNTERATEPMEQSEADADAEEADEEVASLSEGFPTLENSEPIEHRSPPSLISGTIDNELINDTEELVEGDTPPAYLSAIARFISFVFWTTAAIGLTYLLFTQISDRLYPAYKNHSVVQSIRGSLCQFLPCQLGQKSVSNFEVVMSRMDAVNVLSPQKHISIFISNKAKQAQAYPKILLTLKRLDGEISAQRVVFPKEYFTSHDGILESDEAGGELTRPLIKPNKLGKILIKLSRPPEEAVGFEVKVVQ